MNQVENVAVVPAPAGRRGKNCQFIFRTDAKGRSARSIRVTGMAELRQRNKLACARAVTEEAEKGEQAKEGGKHTPSRHVETVSAKNEKLFRQRKVGCGYFVVVEDGC